MGNDFFYGGANRGLMLDALIYVLTHGEGAEGIITVTGECGSGKTTLCHSLMKRLPAQMQTIYLTQPVSTLEEFLNLISRQLKSDLAGLAGKGVEENCTCAPRDALAAELQCLLNEKYAAGKRIVLLIDETQELSAEILDELRALYEVESPHHKLLQIVLLGQNELGHTLTLPQMRKLKGCVTHHFELKPFNRKAVEEYLISRMRAAGHRGPVVFTPPAIKLISMASGGLIHSLNILADRSLETASSTGSPDVTADHVKAAIKDSGIQYSFNWRNWSDWFDLNHRAVGASAVITVTVLGLLGWFALRSPSAEVSSVVASAPSEAAPSAQVPIMAPAPAPIPALVPAPVPAPVPAYPPTAASMPGNTPSPASTAGSSPHASPETAAATRNTQDQPATAAMQQRSGKSYIGGVKLEGYALLEQRVEATTKSMATVDKNQYTIQLFSTDNVQPDRMERFLVRAQKLVDLSDLYVHTVNDGEKAKFRVTYGIYPDRNQAAAAINELPQKYQSSFHPEPSTWGDLSR
ncbi:AAA family ATPase [Nitrosovibrio tenuis]|nr:AAA family ATPase [Nitrosovibrio tenuis]